MQRRVFIACSLDGFIAGPGDDLSWLPEAAPGSDQPDRGFAAFLASVGALLMGRRTYDVVAGFTGSWPYGDMPVLVATRRPLSPQHPTVRPARGTIRELIDAAAQAAGGLDVYLDGGDLIRQALDAELVDEMTVTVVPIILGRGHPLFAGANTRRHLVLTSNHTLDSGLVQLTYRPENP